MGYFTWMPGIGVALGLGIVHAIWLRANGKFSRDPRAAAAPSTTAGDIRS
ncbi:cytochrome bd oxidase small subunit, CydX/CbdX family [Paraburkholderia sp. DGU8]|jgi:predicted outer membrane lipoprotein